MMTQHKYVPPGTVSGKEASEMLGCTRYRLTQMALAGLVQAVSVPGFALLFNRESVEKRAAKLNPPKRPTRPQSRPAAVAPGK
jgi:hypothetical protein